MRSDAELVGLVREGGRGRAPAWRELVDRHTPKLYGVARSFDVDRQTAEDLVQTAWLRFLTRMHQLRDPDALGPWLGMIVRNEARRLVTRRRTVAVGDGWERLADSGPASDEGLIESERAVALRSAFSRLGEECRQLLRLLFVDPPLSYDEISAATGRPRGSIGPSRQRCLGQLRRHLPAGMDVSS
ncbi:MAG: RNA polymerase sigma factor [Ilumatobacteraceae bacterium]